MRLETNVGKKIRDIRIAKGLKQAALDDLADLPRSTSSKIELGKREATASELIRIARALNTTIDSLVNSSPSFVYSEEIRIIEALRELPFEEYSRIIGMIESQVYFTAKDTDKDHKNYLNNLVSELARISVNDQRPRGHKTEVRRVK